MTPTAEPTRKAIPPYLFGHAAAGAALILMGYLLAYMIRFESLLGSWTGPAVLTVVVMVMVMVLLTVRKEEGTLAFGRAFGLSLLAGVLARFGYNVFNILLFHVMRPDLLDVYVDLVLDKSNEVLMAFGGNMPAGMDQMMEQSTRFSISVPGQLLDAGMNSIWVAFVALIVAAILKRSPAAEEGFNG